MSAPRRNKKCPTNCTIYFVQQKDVTKHWGYVILEGNLGYVLSWWSLNPFEQSITPLKKVSFFNKVSREKLNIMIKTILDNSDSIPLISSQDQGKIYNQFYYSIFLRWSFFGIFDEPFLLPTNYKCSKIVIWSPVKAPKIWALKIYCCGFINTKMWLAIIFHSILNL